MIEDQTIPARTIHTACGGEIKDPDRYPSAIHKGKRIYFCTAACLDAFQTDPEHCMAEAIEQLGD